MTTFYVSLFLVSLSFPVLAHRLSTPINAYWSPVSPPSSSRPKWIAPMVVLGKTSCTTDADCVPKTSSSICHEGICACEAGSKIKDAACEKILCSSIKDCYMGADVPPVGNSMICSKSQCVCNSTSYKLSDDHFQCIPVNKTTYGAPPVIIILAVAIGFIVALVLLFYCCYRCKSSDSKSGSKRSRSSKAGGGSSKRGGGTKRKSRKK